MSSSAVKNFYLNPSICNQNNPTWPGGRKADVEPHRLLVEQVSVRVCVGGKKHLYFVDEKAKVNTKYYLE